MDVPRRSIPTPCLFSSKRPWLRKASISMSFLGQRLRATHSLNRCSQLCPRLASDRQGPASVGPQLGAKRNPPPPVLEAQAGKAASAPGGTGAPLGEQRERLPRRALWYLATIRGRNLTLGGVRAGRPPCGDELRAFLVRRGVLGRARARGRQSDVGFPRGRSTSGLPEHGHGVERPSTLLGLVVNTATGGS